MAGNATEKANIRQEWGANCEYGTSGYTANVHTKKIALSFQGSCKDAIFLYQLISEWKR